MDRLAAGPDVLFCYGTLRFGTVLEALLGRIPARVPASLSGWRAAALEGRVYPGLVSAPDVAADGMVLTDLRSREWKILDAFEDDRYELQALTLSSGTRGWAYVWPHGEVRPENWDAVEFEALHLPEYAARCARIAPALAAGRPKPE
ncbi:MULTISPECIES: gamma-glutamylcyclotransferase family protein [Streptomyces]|uniref:Putative gamma-glutamylcyclotransferase n=1 Tax=Streptomyces zinciresistens K42 TaxID=700597 RepID=G2G765_9ACTN|nr:MULTISPECIES: gamma-glutamylcyclotransferase family protein [Streptomyces]EGX60606.1 hypothetical protein SZN_06636 [Streptomyces zinciresistens K42]MDT9695916.1 gamma-glutamylcyclotransferase family protein [Streptomyces sp. P17]